MNLFRIIIGFVVASSAIGSNFLAAVEKNNSSNQAIVQLSLQSKFPEPKTKQLCNKIQKKIDQFFWGRIICNPRTWHTEPGYITTLGNPLIYQVFDNLPIKTTTLVICGVHGDELNSVYQCIHLVRDIVFDNPSRYHNTRVVIAPLVNPDGFFSNPPTRQNGRGIDINRNFPTEDFDSSALPLWKDRYGSNPRKYPGVRGGSEIETKFQIALIKKYKPDKIITIHSPLGWLDIDSPNRSMGQDETDGYVLNSLFNKAWGLARNMSRMSKNYPLINFRVYPGSLGNYAKNQVRIPVYTLELPTSGAEKAHVYWQRMYNALSTAIAYKINDQLSQYDRNTSNHLK